MLPQAEWREGDGRASQDRSKKMTYEIRKSMTKMLECLGPAGEHIWRSKLQGCWGMMPGGQGGG